MLRNTMVGGGVYRSIQISDTKVVQRYLHYERVGVKIFPKVTLAWSIQWNIFLCI